MPKKPAPPLPSAIRILGAPHAVEWNSATIPEDEFGNYLPDQSPPMIKIGSEKILSTFIHECAHGIFVTSGLSQVLPEGVEEALCSALESGLLPLIPLLARVYKLHPPGRI